MEITRLDLPKCQVGEGPVWDEGEQALYYIDILAKKVFRWHPASGEHKSWDVPDIIGSMALREGGGAVVALGNGVHTLDFESGSTRPIRNCSWPTARPTVPGASCSAPATGR